MRIVFWLICLCAAAPALCGAVAFPVLEAPAVYSGGVESESVRYYATLLLNPDHLFILRERMMRAEDVYKRQVLHSWTEPMSFLHNMGESSSSSALKI